MGLKKDRKVEKVLLKNATLLSPLAALSACSLRIEERHLEEPLRLNAWYLDNFGQLMKIIAAPVAWAPKDREYLAIGQSFSKERLVFYKFTFQGVDQADNAHYLSLEAPKGPALETLRKIIIRDESWNRIVKTVCRLNRGTLCTWGICFFKEKNGRSSLYIPRDEDISY